MEYLLPIASHMALLQVTVSESNLASVASIWVGSSGIHLEERYPAVVKVLKVSTVLMVISRSDEGVEVEVSCRAARRQDCQSTDVWEGFRPFGHWTVSINKGTERQYPGAFKSMD
jgi:hypothetical protein